MELSFSEQAVRTFFAHSFLRWPSTIKLWTWSGKYFVLGIVFLCCDWSNPTLIFFATMVHDSLPRSSLFSADSEFYATRKISERCKLFYIGRRKKGMGGGTSMLIGIQPSGEPSFAIKSTILQAGLNKLSAFKSPRLKIAKRNRVKQAVR